MAIEDRSARGSEKEILPCPFCSSLASIQAHGSVFQSRPGYRVECEGMCHAMTCYWHTREEAVTHWNMRAPALIKALQRIADGTEDCEPPFRAMPREVMQNIARNTLELLRPRAAD